MMRFGGILGLSAAMMVLVNVMIVRTELGLRTNSAFGSKTAQSYATSTLGEQIPTVHAMAVGEEL